MEARKGRFVKGQTWRRHKPHWDKEWLYQEYVIKVRSAADIAEQMGCIENNILYWLHKHDIPRRSMREVRKAKHWGQNGQDNPMWKGGTSSERQNFWNSLDWAWAIKAVYGRDKKACQRCGKKQTRKYGQFHIHHRVTFAERELRANLDNLVLLCVKCHHWVHSKQNKTKAFKGAFQISMEGGDNNGREVLDR